MSHVVSIQTELKDLAAVKAACLELGLTFKEGQQTYQWWGHSVGDHPLPAGFTTADLGHCEHALGVPGTNWEVGVTHARNPDGTRREGYTLLCDFFGSRGAPIGRALGGTFTGRECTAMTFHRFLQAYGVAKATLEARRRGYLVTRQAGRNGSVQLVVTGF